MPDNTPDDPDKTRGADNKKPAQEETVRRQQPEVDAELPPTVSRKPQPAADLGPTITRPPTPPDLGPTIIRPPAAPEQPATMQRLPKDVSPPPQQSSIPTTALPDFEIKFDSQETAAHVPDENTPGVQRIQPKAAPKPRPTIPPHKQAMNYIESKVAFKSGIRVEYVPGKIQGKGMFLFSAPSTFGPKEMEALGVVKNGNDLLYDPTRYLVIASDVASAAMPELANQRADRAVMNQIIRSKLNYPYALIEGMCLFPDGPLIVEVSNRTGRDPLTKDNAVLDAMAAEERNKLPESRRSSFDTKKFKKDQIHRENPNRNHIAIPENLVYAALNIPVNNVGLV